jgi:hypothetical protein
MLGAFSGKKIITEAVLLNKEGTPIEEGPLRLTMRVDVFEVGKGSNMLPSGQQLNFKPFSFQFDGTTVLIEPFVWDQVTVITNIVPSEPAVNALLVWFREEFKTSIVSGDGGELNCIHFMSEPKAVSEGMMFELDMGTANSSAFLNMLTTLVGAGSTYIVICEGREAE